MRNRNIRKKVENNDDDSTDIPKTQSRKKPITTLSFENDLQITSKNEYIRRKKPIQILTSTSHEDNEENRPTTCSYDPKSLHELRKTQKFWLNPDRDENQQILPVETIPIEDVDENELELPVSGNVDNLEAIAQEIWEVEIAKRGGVALLGNQIFHSSTSIHSLTSFKSLIEKNVNTFGEKCSREARQLEVALHSRESLFDEQGKLKHKLNIKSQQLVDLQKIQQCASEVTGMWRAKEKLVTELESAIFSCLQNYHDYLMSTKLEKLEHLLADLNQSEELILIDQKPPLRDQIFLELYPLENLIIINRDKFKNATSILLQDVRKDLQQPTELLSKFIKFRTNYPSQYAAAYIEISLAQLIRPYVKLDILSRLHDLYQEDSCTLNLAISNWYQDLIEFDSKDVSASYESTRLKILTDVLRDPVFPLITSSVKFAFNPMIFRSVCGLKDLIRQFLEFIPYQDIYPLMDVIFSQFEIFLKFVCLPLLNFATPGSVVFFLNELQNLQLLLQHFFEFVEFFPNAKLHHFVWQSLKISYPPLSKFVKAIHHENDLYIVLKFLQTLCNLFGEIPQSQDCSFEFSETLSVAMSLFPTQVILGAADVSSFEMSRSGLIHFLDHVSSIVSKNAS